MRATIETIAGVPTRYLHHGSGHYGVLMLHGVGVSANSWLWNLTGLGDDVWAIAPDLLGYGLTGEGGYREGAPQDGIIEHLAALVDHLGLRRVAIVGSSFGSNIACHLFWRLRGCVDGLALVGCGPALNGPRTLSAMYEQSFANGIAAMRNPTIEVCRRRMNNLVFDPAAVPEALLMLAAFALCAARRRRPLRAAHARHQGIRGARAFRRDRPHERTDAADLDSVGRQDARGNLEEAERYAASLPRGDLRIYENCGHLPYLEYPDRFNSDLRAFLAKIRA